MRDDPRRPKTPKPPKPLIYRLPPAALVLTLPARVLFLAVRSLLCGSGEAPLNEDEWAQFLRVADPNGTGKVSTDAFKAMPCWAPPSAELLLSPRSAAKRRAEGAGGAGAPGGS